MLKILQLLQQQLQEKQAFMINYPNEFGLNSVKLTETQEQNIMDCIYKGVKAGKTSEYVNLFLKIR